MFYSECNKEPRKACGHNWMDTSSVSIPLLMDIYIASSSGCCYCCYGHGCVYLFKLCFSPDICLGMGLPDHMAALFLFIYFFRRCGTYVQASLVAQMAKNLPAKQEIWVWSLGREDLLEKGTAHIYKGMLLSHKKDKVMPFTATHCKSK